MRFQKCVVCGIDVDVDNCFGSISDYDTFCSEHDSDRLLFAELEKFKYTIATVNRNFEKLYSEARKTICKAETKALQNMNSEREK